MSNTKHSGFTLAEVLIALTLIGVAAMFTIPKLLQTTTADTQRLKAMESAASLGEALQIYRSKVDKTQVEVPKATKVKDILSVLNTISPYNGDFDPAPTQGTQPLRCDGTDIYTCVRLHNGAILAFSPDSDFNDPAPPPGSETAIWVHIDPDGKYTGGSSDVGSSMVFHLYRNGNILSWGTTRPNTRCHNDLGWYTVPVSPNYDPSWFHW